MPNVLLPHLLLPCIAALVACNPPPKETKMSNPTPVPAAAAPQSRETDIERHGSALPGSTKQGVAANNVAPARRPDSPEEAEGRRTLSTAFVRVGAGEHLAVELRDGRTVVLRDVAMGPRDYCGLQVAGGSSGKKYCGGYGDVAAARPVAGPAPGAPDPRTLNPAELGRGPSKIE